MTGGIVVFVIFSLIGGFLASYCTGEYKDLHTLYFVLVFPTIGVISYYCGEFIGYLKDIRHELNVIRECKTKEKDVDYCSEFIDYLKDISYELNFIREHSMQFESTQLDCLKDRLDDILHEIGSINISLDFFVNSTSNSIRRDANQAIKR